MWARIREFAGCAHALGRTPVERARILWHLTKNLRARFGLARYHPTQTFVLPTRYGALHLRDNFGDVTNLPDLFHHNVYGLEVLEGPGAIVDVGANVGLFAAWAAYHNPDRAIYCFEPLAANAAMVRRNCPRAKVFQAGVGAQRDTISLAVDADGVMASAIATRWPTAPQDVPVLPLDEVVREERIERIAFLKVDTEGMELEVLGGAAEALGRTDRIAMETHGRERHETAVDRLRAHGFQIDDASFDGQTGVVRARRAA